MVHYLSNKELADIFAQIGDLLEIKGDVIYKILAYRKAADTIRDHARPVKDIWREGGLRDIPGVGQAIAEKVEELLTTGKLAFLEKLQAEVPASLTELLQVLTSVPSGSHWSGRNSASPRSPTSNVRRAPASCAACRGWARNPRARS